MKTVEELMMPSTASCGINDTIDIAENKMSGSRAEFLSVVDDEQRLVGIIKHDDLARVSNVSQTAASGLKVNEIMRPTSIAINGHEDEATAYSTMKSERLTRLPVVDDENHLKGSVSFVSIARRIVMFKNNLVRSKKKGDL